MSSVCHTCGVTEDNFSRRSLFDKHVKLHDNSSPSFCDSCGKTYGNDFAFNEHVTRYHLKEFPCSQCTTITNEEQRYFKMRKYVKNQDKCDKTIFNSKKSLPYK